MGPAQRKFWLPLTRLGTFFVTVVVIGNVVFHAFRPSAADLTTADDTTDADYFLRKKKRIQRQFQKTLEKFLGFPAAGAGPDRVSDPVERTTEVVQVAPPASPPPLQAIAPPPPAPSKGEALAFVAPEPAPFIWPEPLAPPRPSFSPVFDVPH